MRHRCPTGPGMRCCRTPVATDAVPYYVVLAAARPGDPYLTWEVVASRVSHAWSQGTSVAWIAPSAYHGKRWLTAMGDPAAVARLATQALSTTAGGTVVGLSLPPAAFELLPSALRPRHLERWTWWWTQTPPRHGSADPDVVSLPPGDARLPDLLAQSGSVYLRPGDPRAEGWFGLVEDGELRACLAYERHHPQVPHLASVVVDGPWRGKGYGARLCGAVTASLLAQGAPAVSLAMMTANSPATALYASLGFASGGSFASGTLPGRRHYPAEPGWQPGGAA